MPQTLDVYEVAQNATTVAIDQVAQEAGAKMEARIVSQGSYERYLPCGEIISGWMLASPIIVTIERESNGEHVVSDSFSTMYGVGKSEEKAVGDYCLSLISYYEILEEQAKTNVQAALALVRLSAYLKKT